MRWCIGRVHRRRSSLDSPCFASVNIATAALLSIISCSPYAHPSSPSAPVIMASVTQWHTSDSDEDPETGPVQACVLPVADLTHCDERVPPASGAEYLRRVQLQAQRCPDVVTSDRRPPLASPRDAAQSVADTDAGFKRCPWSQCLAHDVQRSMAADFWDRSWISVVGD